MTNPHLHGFTHLLHLPPLGRRYLGLPLPLPAAVPAPPVPAPAPVPLLPVSAPGARLLLPVVSHRSETRQQMKPPIDDRRIPRVSWCQENLRKIHQKHNSLCSEDTQTPKRGNGIVNEKCGSPSSIISPFFYNKQNMIFCLLFNFSDNFSHKLI